MNWIELAATITAVVAIIGTIIATQRYNADRRSRIYTRLDESKCNLSEEMRRDYARKDMCTLTHEQIGRELKDINQKVSLIPGIVAQLEILIEKNK